MVPQFPEGIAVRGVGRVTVVPDTATIVVGTDVHAKDAVSAQSQASERMGAVVAAVRGAGVADGDVRTQQVSLNPVYDFSGNTQRLTGYQASQSLDIRLRDLAKLGPVIDAAVGAGATTVSSVTLSVADPAAATDQARDQAVDDARRRAERIAAAAGVTLGPPASIVEGSSAPPIPLAFEGAMFRAAADAATPIETGTTDLSVELTVLFRIE